jgi:uncharacterized protein (TIGR02145 family)
MFTLQLIAANNRFKVLQNRLKIMSAQTRYMKIKVTGYSLFIWLGVLLFFSSGCEEDVENGVADIDGNIYDTVIIGNQVWMTENLRTTRLNDGTDIPLITSDTAWSNLKTPGYCWYGNNEAFFSLNHFGALYNGYAARSGKLCPVGWHVPDDDDWQKLSEYVGWDEGGGKLKEAGTVNWAIPNADATNETGFTALPGGFRNAYYEDCQRFRYRACFWSSTSSNSFELNNNDSNTTSRPSRSTNDGVSVRCIRD